MRESWKEDLASAMVSDLLTAYADVLAELKRRGIVRTRNSPIADVAEGIVARRLGLKLCTNSNKGYDATDEAGVRYQIKSRWLNSPKARRQLSVIRDLDGAPFDYLIVVLFGPNFSVQEAYRMPLAVATKYAQFRQHVNGHIILMKGAILTAPGVEDITTLFRVDGEARPPR
jgi:hypothetical protein